jgi:hypothetical protein
MSYGAFMAGCVSILLLGNCMGRQFSLSPIDAVQGHLEVTHGLYTQFLVGQTPLTSISADFLRAVTIREGTVRVRIDLSFLLLV